MLTSEQLAQAIAYNRETRNIEFKGGGNWNDNSFQGKIIRGILALSNTRDGGNLIIGVRQQGATLVAEGVSSIDLPSWNEENVLRKVSEYADPPVEIRINFSSFEGKTFVVIAVEEFRELPTVCRKSGTHLAEGALYVRPFRKPESTPVPSQNEMRELLDMAVEKRLRKLMASLNRAGLPLAVPTPPSASALYDAEGSDLP